MVPICGSQSFVKEPFTTECSGSWNVSSEKTQIRQSKACNGAVHQSSDMRVPIEALQRNNEHSEHHYLIVM